MSTDIDQIDALKARFIASRGYWDGASDALLALDRGFFTTAVELAEVPGNSDLLPPKIKALLRLAFDVAITHLDASAVEQDIANALQLGASAAEVLEVCQLTSVLGIHSCTVGVPMLAEELRALGREAEMGDTEFDVRRQTHEKQD